MFVEQLHVEAVAFLGSESVHIAADRVNLAGNVFGRSVFSALEHHVLNEMRDAVPLRIFVAGTALDPNADRDRADVFHLFSDDRQPIGQDFAMNVAELFYHILYQTSAHPGRNEIRLPHYCYIPGPMMRTAGSST